MDFSHLKDNLPAIAHQTRQSLRVIVGEIEQMRKPNPHAFCIWPLFNCCGLAERWECLSAGAVGGVILEGWGGGGALLRPRQMQDTARPLSNASASTFMERNTYGSGCLENRKPPFSCWCESRFSQLWIYNVAYSSYTSNIEHNYTITSKAYNPSFIKVITVCLPYGPIVFMYLPLSRL